MLRMLFVGELRKEFCNKLMMTRFGQLLELLVKELSQLFGKIVIQCRIDTREDIDDDKEE